MTKPSRPERPRQPLSAGERLIGSRRHFALRQRSELQREVGAIDETLSTLHARRRSLVGRLVWLRDRLWPRRLAGAIRRVPVFDEAPLPPRIVDVQGLHGRELRGTCLALLARHGELPLRELHGLLRRYGYDVSGPRAVQALADALGYEAECGRVERVARGVYRVDADSTAARQLRAAAARPLGQALPWSSGPRDATAPVVDPTLRADPDRWTPSPWPSSTVVDLDEGDEDVVDGEALAEELVAIRKRVRELVDRVDHAPSDGIDTDPEAKPELRIPDWDPSTMEALIDLADAIDPPLRVDPTQDPGPTANTRPDADGPPPPPTSDV